MRIQFLILLISVGASNAAKSQILEPDSANISVEPIVTTGQKINFKSTGINYGLDFKYVYKIQSSYYSVANTIEIGHFWGILFNSHKTINQGVFLFQLDTNMNLISKQNILNSAGNKGYATNLLGNYILGNKMISFYSIKHRLRGKKYIMCNSFDLITNTKKTIKIAELNFNSQDKFEFFKTEGNSKIQINHIFVSTKKQKTLTTKDSSHLLIDENLQTESVILHDTSDSKFVYLGDFKLRVAENLIGAYINESTITLIDNSNNYKNSPQFDLGQKNIKFNSYYYDPKNTGCYILLEVLGGSKTPVKAIALHVSSRNDSLFIDSTLHYDFRNIYDGLQYKTSLSLGYVDLSESNSQNYSNKQIKYNQLIFDPKTQNICVFHDLYSHYTETETTRTQRLSSNSNIGSNPSYTTETKTVHHYTSGPLICTFINKDLSSNQHSLDISQTHRNMSLPIDLKLNVTSDYKYHISSGNKIYKINFNDNSIVYFDYVNNNNSEKYQRSTVVNVGDELIIIDQKGFKNVSFSRVTFPD